MPKTRVTPPCGAPARAPLFADRDAPFAVPTAPGEPHDERTVTYSPGELLWRAQARTLTRRPAR